jgi:4-aminobutyrate aminotransferase/(S)-3-amino-2-methylpropionate transaminase
MQANNAHVGDVRGRGAMMAIELVADDGITPDADLTKRIAAAAHAEGVIVLTCGTYGNVLRFLPPLTIPDHLLHEGLDILERVLEENR